MQLHVLINPVTWRHPFELLVGHYLSMPTGKGGYHTLGLFLDTFSQHLWVTKFKMAGTANTTIDSLKGIFHNFSAPETFMTDGESHFKNSAIKEFCTQWLCTHHVVSRAQLLEQCRDNSVVWENPVRENTTHYTVEYTCKIVLVVSYHALGCERTYYPRV